MKKFALCLMTTVSSVQALAPQFVMAQTSPTVSVIAGAGNGQTGFLSAGDYNINKIDASYTEAMQSIISNNSKIQQQDKEFLLSRGKAVSDSIRELIEKRRKFQELSQKAAMTTSVTLDQVLALVNDINTLVDKIHLDIREASIINVATLPSATASVGNINLNMGPGSTINAAAAFEGFLKTTESLFNDCNNLTFKTVGHKGQYASIDGMSLTPDLSRWPQMTPEEVQEALVEVQRLSIISKSTQDMQQFLADQVVMSIRKYIQAIGTDEFLRSRNDNDLMAAQEAYKSVEKFMFMRSYLRRKYGLQIGALQAKPYPMQLVNLERWTNKDLLLPMIDAAQAIRNQTSRTDADLMQNFNDTRQWVEQYDKMLTPVLSKNAKANRAEVRQQIKDMMASSSDSGIWASVKGASLSGYKQLKASFATRTEIMSAKPVILDENSKNVAYNSDDTGLIARASGVTTFLTGQTSTTQALLAVMRLVLADVREEVMLSQGDWATVQSYHQKRFMANPEQTAASVKIMCDIDNTLSPAARDRAKALVGNPNACAPSPGGLVGGMTSGGNVLTTFRNLLGQYDRVELARAQKARNLETLIDSSLNAQTQEGDRADDSSLFGPSNN